MNVGDRRDERPVLVAPDAFKGTFTAAEVADAIAEGLESVGVLVDRCPIADGGEGTAAVLRSALGGDEHEVEVTGPLGDPVTARFTMLATGDAGRGASSARGRANRGGQRAPRRC